MDNIVKKLMPMGPVQRRTITTEEITINFTQDGIGTISEHMEEIAAIREANAGDTIVVFMSGCPGGYADTTMSIFNALLATEANTVAIIEGRNSSAGTIIPMACREVVVTPHASMMIHTASGGEYGTIANTATAAAFTAETLHEFLDDVYDGFLTDEELVMIKDGREIYLGASDIGERLQRRKAMMHCDLHDEDGEGCGLCADCVAHYAELESVAKPTPKAKVTKPKKKTPAAK